MAIFQVFIFEIGIQDYKITLISYVLKYIFYYYYYKNVYN